MSYEDYNMIDINPESSNSNSIMSKSPTITTSGTDELDVAVTKTTIKKSYSKLTASNIEEKSVCSDEQIREKEDDSLSVRQIRSTEENDLNVPSISAASSDVKLYCRTGLIFYIILLIVSVVKI